MRLVPPQDWPTLGWEVIDWIEAYLCHGPGDVEGDPLVLDDEECQLLLDCYRIYPRGHEREGRRVVTYAEYSRAKGRAKSEKAGAVVCAEAKGPVRFDGWDSAGEPVGRPVKSPLIRCLATEEGQAGNTYDNVVSMLRHAQDSAPEVFGGMDVGLTRILLDGGLTRGGGEVRPSSAAAASKDGGKETFAVADEVHLYTLPELRSMHRTVLRNLRKRKAAEPWMLATTTQYAPGEGSVAEENATEAEAQARHPRRRRLGFLRDHREGHEVKDWSSDKEVMAALREAYGPAAEWMDLQSILEDEVRAHGVTQAEVQRYWLNQRATTAGRAVDAEDYDAMVVDRSVPDGVPVVLGFDGSKLDQTTAQNPDTTALTVWELGDRPHLDLVGVWDPKATGRTELRSEVRAMLNGAMQRWQVKRVVCDPAYWRDEIGDWAEEWGEDVVIQMDTNSSQRMGPAVERMVLEAIPERRFTVSADPVLRRHFLNAVLTPARRGTWKSVGKPKSTEKIDAFVAALIAYHELPNVETASVTHEPVVLVF